MYNLFLTLHNITRWVVLIFGVLAVIRAFYGWFGGKSWQKIDNQLGLGYSISMDIQVLLGLLLYFLFSPITRTAFGDFGAAMADSSVRFFAVEHLVIMILALVFIHLGRILGRRAGNDRSKHMRTAIFFTIGLLLILAGIPWERALLPF